jgi:SAM-dependent methyltransferase
LTYDDAAASYDAVAVPYFFAPIARLLVDRLAPSPASSILDAGAGTGIVGSVALEKVSDARVVAADVSVPMLRRAAERGLRSVAADIRALPCRAGAFDVVIASFVLSHLEAPPAAVSELVRVLRRGGRLGATSWAVSPADNALGASWIEVASRFVDLAALEAAVRAALPSEGALASLDAFTALLEACGLAILEARTIAFGVRMRLDEYLATRAISAAARFVRSQLDPPTWHRFEDSVAAQLRARFGSTAAFDVEAHLVVASKTRP